MTTYTSKQRKEGNPAKLRIGGFSYIAANRAHPRGSAKRLPHPSSRRRRSKEEAHRACRCYYHHHSCSYCLYHFCRYCRGIDVYKKASNEEGSPAWRKDRCRTTGAQTRPCYRCCKEDAERLLFKLEQCKQEEDEGRVAVLLQPWPIIR